MTNPITVNSTKTVTSIIRNGTAIEKMMLAWEWQPQGLFLGDVQAAWYDPVDTANDDWRRNLLTWSEDFSNSVWLTSNITKTSSTKITATAVNNIHAISNPFNHVSGQTYTYQQVLTYENTRYVSLRIFAGIFPHVCFDLTGDGAIAASDTGAVGTITKLSSGSFLCTITVTATSTGVGNVSIFLQTGTTNLGASWLAVGTEAVSATAAQLELGSVATTYQRITDVNTEVRALFPNNTMFQDSTGSAPNAAASSNQVVGMWLDKSKLLALGPELWSNTGVIGMSATIAANGSGWNVTATGTSFVGIRLNTASLGTSSYKATVSWSGNVNGRSIGLLVGGGSTILGTTVSGSVTVVHASTGVSSSIQLYAVSAAIGETFTFTVLSVRELPDNHALQTSTSLRPLFGRSPVSRRNLLTYSEQFENAIWTKTAVTVTTNTAIAPNGTLTADLMTGGSNWFAGTATGAGAANQQLTGSIWVYPPAGVTSLTIRIDRSGIAQGNQTVKTVVPQTWNRVTHTATLDSGTAAPVLRIDLTGGASLTVWGAQLELGSVATPYQKVVSALDVTEAGKPSYAFMRPDLSDDKLTTNMASTKNLLRYTEEFDNALWVKDGVTVSSTQYLAPDGTTTAEMITATATAGLHRIYFNRGDQSVEPATISVWLKANTSRFVSISLVDGGTGVYGVIDLQLGSFTQSGALAGTGSFSSATVTPYPNGWYRCTVSGICEPRYALIGLSYSGTPTLDAYGAQSFTATGVESIYVWGAQVELGSIATPYEYGGFKGGVVVAGKNGTAFQSDVVSPTGVMDLGPLEYTGGTPGILRAVGDVVGYTMARKKFSDIEKAQLIRYYKKRGAKGVLVTGSELVINGDFSNGLNNWVVNSGTGNSVNTVSGGIQLLTTQIANANYFEQAISFTSGKQYEISFNATVVSGSAYVGLGITTAGAGRYDISSSGAYKVVLVGQSTINSVRFSRNTAGDITFNNISVRELRPEEEW